MSKMYNYLMRVGIIALVLACAGGVTATFGAQLSESVWPREKLVFYFPKNVSILQKGYKKNDSELERLHQLLASDSLPQIERIVVMAGSSPEGYEGNNVRLTNERAVGMCGIIFWKFSKFIEKRKIPVEIRSVFVNDMTGSLRQLIEKMEDVASRRTLIEILDADGTVSEKIARIRRECTIETYGYISSRLFEELRNSTVYVLYEGDAGYGLPWSPPEPVKKSLAATGVRQSSAESIAATSASAQAIDQAASQSAAIDSSRIAVPAATDSSHIAVPAAPTEVTPVVAQRSYTKRASIAIKTNLLFDLATAANVELEIPIGRRWSIATGVVFPLWHFNNRHSMIITEVSLEPRLWLGDREVLVSGKKRSALTGHFIGVYGNWIENYDLQFKRNGVMGTGYGMGITYGFAHRLSRSFNMEYSVGVGAMDLKNKSFGVTDDYDYKVLKKESQGWKFLPTRAKISLVWLIGDKQTNRK